MAKITCEHKSNFTVINNTIIVDSRLEILDRLLLILLLSLPDDWNFSIKGIAKLLNKSPSTISASIQRLEKTGFIEKKEQTRKNGHFDRCDWIIYEDPSKNPKYNASPSSPNNKPSPNNKVSVKSSSDYSEQLNIELNKIKKKTKETSSKDAEYIINLLNHVVVPDTSIKNYIIDSVNHIFSTQNKSEKKIKYLDNVISIKAARALLINLTPAIISKAITSFINATKSQTILHPAEYMRTLLLTAASEYKSSSFSSFNQFPQRKYDFDELERDALVDNGFHND